MALGRAILTLATGLAVAACDPISWTRVTLNHPLKSEDVAFIVPGQTTLKDVVGRLGAPDQLLPIRDGMAANYLYEDSKYFRVNFGWPLGFIDPLSLCAARPRPRQRALERRYLRGRFRRAWRRRLCRILSRRRRAIRGLAFGQQETLNRRPRAPKPRGG
jgi:hypothetical protein